MKRYIYLKVRLKEMDITYDALAGELGITTANLSNKLNGRGDFRISELDKILRIVGETDEHEVCRLLELDSKSHKKKFA